MTESTITASNSDKIAILGLANAGKTSLIKVLSQEFEMLTNLTPTQNIERTNLELMGHLLVFTDFGGQKTYRDKFLASPERYFDNISYLFYVVDSQAPEILNDSIQYFNAILVKVKEFNPNARIIIIFHKNDPKLEVLLDQHQIKQKFLEGIAPIVEKTKTSLYIYKTSIYNHLSVITAFSQPLLDQEEIYQIVSDALKRFIETYKCEFGILFIRNFFALGIAQKETVNQDERDDVLKVFMQTHQTDFNKTTEYDCSLNPLLKIKVLDFDIKVGTTHFPFYIAIGYKNTPDFYRTILVKAIYQLKRSLQKILSNADMYGLQSSIKS